MALLSSLKPSEFRVLLLINEYLQVNKKRGFTYRGLRAYWSSLRIYNDHNDPAREWHTVERVIRKLAEKGFLERRFYKKGRSKYVVFFPTPLFWEIIEERRGLIHYG